MPKTKKRTSAKWTDRRNMPPLYLSVISISNLPLSPVFGLTSTSMTDSASKGLSLYLSPVARHNHHHLCHLRPCRAPRRLSTVHVQQAEIIERHRLVPPMAPYPPPTRPDTFPVQRQKPRFCHQSGPSGCEACRRTSLCSRHHGGGMGGRQLLGICQDTGEPGRA